MRNHAFERSERHRIRVLGRVLVSFEWVWMGLDVPDSLRVITDPDSNFQVSTCSVSWKLTIRNQVEIVLSVDTGALQTEKGRVLMRVESPDYLETTEPNQPSLQQESNLYLGLLRASYSLLCQHTMIYIRMKSAELNSLDSLALFRIPT